jgi:transcriptional antiterminator NusG
MSEPEPIDEQKPESMSGHDSLDELLAEKPASQKSDIEEKESQVEEEAKVPAVEPESGDQTSHLFAVRTTGGQEKIVMRLLETKMKMGQIDVQSVLLLDDLKGYVVVEAQDPPSMFNAIQGIRHIRGQLRGELQYNEIDKYLIKKSTVTELSVDNTVEIIGGPFKGMKATVKRVDQEKEEAVVILLDAPYQLPVTVDANHLKKVLS